MRTYQELMNSARDRFTEILGHRPDLKEFLARGPNFDEAEIEGWQEDHGHIVERCAEHAVPDEISDATLLTLLREKPELLSREGYAGGDSIRDLAIEGIRDLIETDLKTVLDLPRSQQPEATAPTP